MYPFFNVLGLKISAYSVMAVLGGIFVALFAFLRLRGKKKDWQEVFYFITYAFGFLVLGAMLLYQIVEFPNLIKGNFSMGLVFYGGLYGALIGIGVHSKINEKDSRELFMYLTPAIPLFHVVGRIGCFLSGCCHGMESESMGIMHPNGISYFPVQLVEACGDLIIFIILCFLKNKKKKYYQPLGIYLVLYGIMRFVLEFFRGDEVRGFLGMFSTSQWISLVTIPLGIYCLVVASEKNILEKFYTPGKAQK